MKTSNSGTDYASNELINKKLITGEVTPILCTEFYDSLSTVIRRSYGRKVTSFLKGLHKEFLPRSSMQYYRCDTDENRLFAVGEFEGLGFAHICDLVSKERSVDTSLIIYDLEKSKQLVKVDLSCNGLRAYSSMAKKVSSKQVEDLSDRIHGYFNSDKWK